MDKTPTAREQPIYGCSRAVFSSYFLLRKFVTSNLISHIVLCIIHIVVWNYIESSHIEGIQIIIFYVVCFVYIFSENIVVPTKPFPRFIIRLSICT